MKNLKTRIVGLLILAALLYLSGFGEWLKHALQDDPQKTLETTIALVKPFGKALLSAGLVVYLAWIAYGWLHKKCVRWSERHIHIHRVQEIAQSAFPVAYWILTALAVVYCLDHTLSWITAGTLFGTGVILKPELDNAWACCSIQTCVKVKLNEWVKLVDKDDLIGQVTEINLLFARLTAIDGSEIRVNNSDLRSMTLVVLPGKPEPEVTKTEGDGDKTKS